MISKLKNIIKLNFRVYNHPSILTDPNCLFYITSINDLCFAKQTNIRSNFLMNLTNLFLPAHFSSQVYFTTFKHIHCKYLSISSHFFGFIFDFSRKDTKIFFSTSKNIFSIGIVLLIFVKISYDFFNDKTKP